MGTCAFWPVPPTSEPHAVSVPGLPPVLVVSTTHDPATPYQAGVDLAKQLGGALLTFDGTQHTVVFQGDAASTTSRTVPVDGTVPPAGASADRLTRGAGHRRVTVRSRRDLRAGRMQHRSALRANMFAMRAARLTLRCPPSRVAIAGVCRRRRGLTRRCEPALQSYGTALRPGVAARADRGHRRHPDGAVRHRVGARRLRQARRRASQLAVIRVPATGHRIGVADGQPGRTRGVGSRPVAGWPDACRTPRSPARFDLVGFDPRGVGHSTPQVRCRTDAEFDAYRREPMTDYSPAGVAHIEQLYQQRAPRAASTRPAPDFLANVGTASTAQDMDVVRAALGENQINYLGFSYGTELGATYAEKYPDRVRAMVLDGAVDPESDPIEENIRQTGGFQTAFDDYAADCARSADCPLGTDPTQFVERYHELVNPLVSSPARPRSARAELSGRDHGHRQRALHAALLEVPDQWSAGSAARHRRRRPVVAGRRLPAPTPAGHYDNQQDAFTAIRCVDAPFPTDPAVWADADRRAREAAPFMAYGDSPDSPPATSAPCGRCRRRRRHTTWRRPARQSRRRVDDARSGDAVPGGRRLARELDAALITFDGTQHTVVFNGDPCVDPAVVAFLTGLTQPPQNLHC